MDRVVEDVVSDLELAPVEGRTDDRAADGRSRRWDTHRAARRDDLTHAARRAIHHGGPDLSMDEIAAAIGTSKSIVYRYFNDRSGLQTAVGEAVLEDMGAALAEVSHRAHGSHEVIRAMVGVYLGMISTSPSVYAFVTRGGEVGAAPGPLSTLADDAAALLVPILGDVLLAQGRPREGARMWAAGVIGFVRGAAEVWLSERVDAAAAETDALAGPEADEADLDELADTLAGWICAGTPSSTPSTATH